MVMNAEERKAFEKEKAQASLEEKPRGGLNVLQKVQKYVSQPLKAYKIPAREKRVSAIAKKAIHLASPKSSLAKAITTSAQSKKGRGRPRKSYKTRYVPGYGFVKVPTAVYKKMMSKIKAEARLKKAYEKAEIQTQADQLAMQQDMRYQQGAEDQFLMEPDQVHEMEVMRAQQQAEAGQQMDQQREQYSQQQRVGVGQKIVKGFGDFGRGLSRVGKVRLQQPMFDEFGRPIQQIQGQQVRSQMVGMGVRREPTITAVSKRANILNVPNIFNNPGRSNLSKRRLY